MKKILFTILVAATFNAAAQTIPSYVPTNGLVGYWPFNGNANDVSGNGNNGTVNGATLTSDRFGNPNDAYYLNGVSDYININNSILPVTSTSSTVSLWFLTTDNDAHLILDRSGAGNTKKIGITINTNPQGNTVLSAGGENGNCAGSCGCYSSNTSPLTTVWNHAAVVNDLSANTSKIFLNGQLVATRPSFCYTNFSTPTSFGRGNSFYNSNGDAHLNGKIDDIGIWNRALTQQEITDIHTATNCTNNTTITPQINSITTGNNASFTATTSDANPSYVWQTNFGQGFQTLNNFGSYAGVNTSSLNIANVQLANHNQPIRVITTSGTCIDTSNIASIHIADTCISTQLVTVTDTLIIHANLTGISPPNNSNTIKVYPNPAQNYLIINNGNFALMSGYTCEIVNALGQQIFSSLINQQTFTIDISTWTGNGLYFLKIKDASNAVIENRKIVLN